MKDVVIVGAGHAGVQLAAALAKSGSALSVRMLGDEPGLPYERPPLSKGLLHGGGDPVLLRSAEYWQRSPVELRTGTTVVAVDPAARRVHTAAGETLDYRTLVWAAGGRAARCGLPGEDLPGVHTLRGLADLAALRADLATARTAVVVGGGYIGLEAAAALRRLGLAVTVVEVAPRLLARVTGPTVSRSFAALHRSEGVDVRLGVGVDAVLGDPATPAGTEQRPRTVPSDSDGCSVGVRGVRLADGTEIAADIVIVGVGMRPAVAPLVDAGARGDGAGIDVDQECRTSLPGVFAIGDCARTVNAWSASGAVMRVESVHNAGHHAATVARVLAGLPAPDPVPPRFWSTQYGRELKTVGLPDAGDEEVLRGDPDRGPFSVLYLRDGVLAAIDTLDRPRDFARAQALIAARWRPERDVLVDAGQDLPRPAPATAGRP